MDMTLEDWLDNATWFDIKFLVDINGSDYTQELTNDSYSTAIKKVLTRLNLPTNKLLHLGRNCGTKALDMNKVPGEDVRRMGQWNCSVYDNSYSSKIPMKAIRNLAGYNTTTGMYFNTRTTVMPPQALLNATPIGCWSYSMLDQLTAYDVNGKHPTAFKTLRFFCDLSVIYLQDAAAMILLHPERKSHPVFDLPLFATTEFNVSFRVIQYLLTVLGTPLLSHTSVAWLTGL
jgi:hypothetical protein